MAVYRRMVTLAVSGSTSTSTMCVPKPLVGPSGLTVARPTTGPPVCPSFDGQLGERHRLVVVREDAVGTFDQRGVALPEDRRPLAHLAENVEPDFVGRQPRGKGDAAAAGDVGVAHAVGVGHVRLDLFGRDAQRLGQLHGDAGARAADVGRAFDQADRAVGIDVGRGARLQPDVEPDSRWRRRARDTYPRAATSSGRSRGPPPRFR